MKASCGCIPTFCAECIALPAHDTPYGRCVSFPEWLVGWGEVCAEDHPAGHPNGCGVDYAECWANGRCPLDTKDQRVLLKQIDAIIEEGL